MRPVLGARAEGAEPPAPRPGGWPAAPPFAIGDVKIANRVVQAPLAGIANRAFRRQSRRHGAGATVSEMVSAHALVRHNPQSHEMATPGEDESPVGIQIFGAEPAVMAEAAAVVASLGADWIDVNMGCPAGKVCRTGAGSALLDDLPRARALLADMVAAVDIPVTVKMRRGMTPARSRPVEAARTFADAGAAAICFHPRAAAEEYGGEADHAITAGVVEAVDIPVIASGDIRTPEEVARVMEDTGCAAVAIGRAALGNPWVFGAMVTGAAAPAPTAQETAAELRRYAAELIALQGARRAAKDLRKFYPWYAAVHDLPDERMYRMQTADTADEAIDLFEEWARRPAAA